MIYNFISIIFLVAAINSISSGIEWFISLIAASIGFAIAGSLYSISSRIDEFISRTNIIKKDLIDGTTKIFIRKEPYNNKKE